MLKKHLIPVLYSSIFWMFTTSIAINKVENNSSSNSEEVKITFSYIAKELDYSLFKDIEGYGCHIKIKFTYPAYCPDKKLLRRLNEIFIGKFFGDKYKNMAPDEAVKAYSQEYVHYYINSWNDKELEDLRKEIMAGQSFVSMLIFNKEIKNEIVFRHKNLLSFSVYCEGYEGGAHGGFNTQAYTIDLKTTQIIREKNIFYSDYRKKLSALLIAKILKDNNVSSLDELKEKGYFDISKLEPNDNFFVKKGGIEYIYHPYEIACFANGEIRVFLSFEELKPIINPKSPIKNLLES